MHKRVSTLDAARGVAIALVLYAHFGGDPLLSVPAGNAGVILFFFLSGFLIFKTFDAKSYVFKRAFRILPMYWVSVALIYGLETWPAATAIANALFIAPPLGLPRMSGVYWTLYVEVAFYAVAPLLIWMPAAARIAPILLAALWLAPMPGYAPFYIAFCLIGFQVGMWSAGRLASWVLAANLAVVCLIASTSVSVGWWLGPVALACCLVLIGAVRFTVSIPPLEWLGRISYSLYLLHAIVGYKLYPDYGAAGAIAASIAASAATYMLIERPFIRIGNQLVERFERFGVTIKLRTPTAIESADNTGP